MIIPIVRVAAGEWMAGLGVLFFFAGIIFLIHHAIVRDDDEQCQWERACIQANGDARACVSRECDAVRVP